ESGVAAGHQVGDQAAHEAVQSAVLVVVGRAFENQLAIGLLDGDLRRQGALELALRPFDLHAARTDGHRDLVGHREGQLSNPRQLFPSISCYQTYASTSPPRPWRSACRPLMTPSLVLRITIPSPPRTRGISVLRAYTRRPGRLIRLMPEITRVRSGRVLKMIRIV